MSARAMFFAVLMIFFVGAISIATAQQYPYNVDTKPPRGFMPTADQLTSPVDSVDPVSGKLHLQIPLASVPRGRAGTSFDVDLMYDSHLYDLYVHEIQALGNNPPPVIVQELSAAGSTGGWTYNFKNFRLEGETRVDLDSQCPSNGPLRVYRYRVGLPDGSMHILHLKGFSEELSNEQYDGQGFFGIKADGKPPTNGSGTPLTCWTNSGWLTSGRLTYFTTDGSYLKLEIDTQDGVYWWNKTWTLYFPDGRRAQGKGSQIEALYDANGNKIVFENDCVDAGCNRPRTRIYHEQDLTHDARKVEVLFNTTDADLSNTNVTQKTDTVTATGPHGTNTWTIHWLRFTLSGRNYKWGDASGQELTPLGISHWVVSSVDLPKAESTSSVLSYQFTYSDNSDAGYGEVDSMTTPSGAIYDYSYRYEGATCTSAASCPDAASLSQYNWITQRSVSGSGVNQLTWTYEFDLSANFKSTVHNPDGGTLVHWFTSPANWGGGLLVNRIDEPNGSVKKRVWAQNKAYPLIGGLIQNPNNPYVQKETVTVGNSSGSPSKTAVTEIVIDKNGNLKQRTEYDWVNYNPSAVENGTTSKRVTKLWYHIDAPTATDSTNATTAYWFPNQSPLSSGDPRRLDALRRRETSTNGADVSAVTEYVYDNELKAGNVTFEKRWDNVKSPSVPDLGTLSTSNSQVLQRGYGSYGNLADIYAPEIRTHISYDSDGNFPTQVQYAYQAAEERSWTYSWDSNASALNSKTDSNNNVVTSYEYDNVWRVKFIREAGLRQTETVYDDVNRRVTAKADAISYQDGHLQARTHYDVLGRVFRVQSSDGADLTGTTDGILVTTNYGISATGAWVVGSTPYRTTSDDTLEWTCSQHDQLGRVVSTVIFKGSTAPTSCTANSNTTGSTQIVYNADQTTTTDPASKARRETRDGLGRLTGVNEDPNSLNYATTYMYDPLDNLTAVTQGSQTRTFDYSSLSRLRSAVNPESGTTSYTYYDSGDLNIRTDARSISTTYTYDGLHRVLTKDYSDFTPDVNYHYYTSGSYKAGQLDWVDNGVAKTQYSTYDALGRATGMTQTINGLANSNTFGYAWYPNGSLQQMNYPSGRVVMYDVDYAGRVSKVRATAPTSRTYADMTAVTEPYAADGRLAKTKLGNNLYETREYHTPGTPTSYKLGTSSGGSQRLQLDYNFSGTANNGNITSQTVTNGSYSRSQSFTYDGLNRLDTASESGGYSRTYGHDQYGNHWVASPTTGLDIHEPTSSSNFSATTNRLSVQSSTYDSAGNQTFYTPYTLGYDAENRNISATSSSSGNATFAYDGEGKRVKKTWIPGGGTGTITYYAYDGQGQLAAEYSSQGGGSSGTNYPFTDMLGSVRGVTNSSGTLNECYDYMPFGQLLTDNGRAALSCAPTSQTPVSAISQKFTGKERDMELGLAVPLDFFGARYMSAPQSRFTSPDQPFVDQVPADPQSWNLFSYVRNNPLRYTDPTGMACVDDGAGGWRDDSGPGGTCLDALKGDIAIRKKPSFTVTAEDPQSLGRAMAQRVDATNDLITTGAFVSIGGGAIGGIGSLALGIDATLVGLKARFVDPPPTQTLAMIPLPAPEINWARQELHFPGWKNYVVGKSMLTANPEELASRAGTGTPVSAVPRGTPGFRERVDFGKVIGQYVDPASGRAVPTTKGIIHYANDGIHIVPARP